jgi:hypothetical protein
MGLKYGEELGRKIKVGTNKVITSEAATIDTEIFVFRLLTLPQVVVGRTELLSSLNPSPF